MTNIQILAIESIINSINTSNLSDMFIVRGSYISRFYVGPYQRICQDLDLLYLEEYSEQVIKEKVKDIISNVCDSEIIFDISTITFKTIWENSLSPGLRADIHFSYKSLKSRLQIDISGGDPLVSQPINVLVNSEKKLFAKTVDIEILAAWKLHGLFEILNGAWTAKTLWDFYLLSKYNNLNSELLSEAIKVAFESRYDPPEILKRLLYGDFGQSRGSRKSWNNDILALSKGEIISLDEVLKEVRIFLIPVLNLEDDGTLLNQSEVITYRVKKLKVMNTKEAKLKLGTLKAKTRVLSHDSYYSIPHLSTSRKGSSDRCINIDKENMLVSTIKKEGDIVIVQEKLDGSCVSVYKKEGNIYALGRDGCLAEDSANEGLKLWSDWVDLNRQRFIEVLNEGERICGEWLALVHGTRYHLNHEPFVVFDLFSADNISLTQENIAKRIKNSKFVMAKILHKGTPCSVEKAIELLGSGFHGSIDHPEGMIWRLERENKTVFLAKYVFHDKKDGVYLPEISKNKALWNWYPSENSI